MADDYRQRCADAAMNAWSMQAVVCGHTQTVPIGNLVDAVLAVRDDELAQLRQELDTATDRMEADRLKHREERGIWKECDDRQWQQIHAAEAEVARLRARLDAHPTDDVTVRRADLDLVMNGAGDATRMSRWAAACQRIRDALEEGQHA